MDDRAYFQRFYMRGSELKTPGSVNIDRGAGAGPDGVQKPRAIAGEASREQFALLLGLRLLPPLVSRSKKHVIQDTASDLADHLASAICACVSLRHSNSCCSTQDILYRSAHSSSKALFGYVMSAILGGNYNPKTFSNVAR